MHKKLVLIIILFVWHTNFVYCQKANSTFSCFIIDIKTNEPIIGCLILSDGIGSAVSDSSGYFSLKLQPGIHTIELQSIGYEKLTKEIRLDNSDEEYETIFYLAPEAIEIEKVTITGEVYKEVQDFKTYELQSGDIKNIPVFLEADALRAVQALPGVTTNLDFSSSIFLRGGNYDETAIKLDNVNLYNANHIGGAFGAFSPDIVGKEILYPSNYPVQHSGALSGILDIYSKNGNRERIKGIGSIGLLSSGIYLEGPLLNNNFIFSYRRTYPDLLIKMLTGIQFPYYFYDTFGKINLPLDKSNLFTISGFYSNDTYELFNEGIVLEKKDNINWGNKYAKFNYTHFFDKGEFSINGSLSNSFLFADAKGYSYKHPSDSIENVFIDNNISELTLSTVGEFQLTGQHVNIGIEFSHLKTKYNWDIHERDLRSFLFDDLQTLFFDFAPPVYSFNKSTNVFSFYLSDKIQLNKNTDLLLGFRLTYLEKLKSYLTQPYFLIGYKLNDNLKLTGSYGRYYQYFYTKREMVNSTIYSPYTAYFIAEDKNRIPVSDHFSLGIKAKDIFENTDLEIEGYYKVRENLFTSNELTETYSFADGYSAGIDVLLKKKKGKINGWFIYSFSRSIKEDGDEKYFANYDRTHNFKLLLNYELNDTWNVNAFWVYATGMPLTPAVGKYVGGGIDNTFGSTFFHSFEWYLQNGNKNSLRYPDFNRLDIGITGSFIWGEIIAKPYLQIMNVYMSKNGFRYDPNPSNTNIDQGTEIGSFIIPTIGLTLEF